MTVDQCRFLSQTYTRSTETLWAPAKLADCLAPRLMWWCRRPDVQIALRA